MKLAILYKYGQQNMTKVDLHVLCQCKESTPGMQVQNFDHVIVIELQRRQYFEKYSCRHISRYVMIILFPGFSIF